MKTNANRDKILGLLTVLGLGLVTHTAFATGIGTSGGGDACRDLFDQNRIEIKGWIERDEAKDLSLEAGWVYNDPASTHSYKPQMLSVLADRAVIVTCYLSPDRMNDPQAKKIADEQGVSFKSITIGNPPTPTACINYQDQTTNELHIDCDYDRIMDPNSAGDPNFRIVHHEFASLVGVEKKDGTTFSDYFVSNQLAQYGGVKSVRYLGPKRTDAGDVSTAVCDIEMGPFNDYSVTKDSSGFSTTTKNPEKAISIWKEFSDSGNCEKSASESCTITMDPFYNYQIIRNGTAFSAPDKRLNRTLRLMDKFVRAGLCTVEATQACTISMDPFGNYSVIGQSALTKESKSRHRAIRLKNKLTEAKICQ